MAGSFKTTPGDDRDRGSSIRGACRTTTHAVPNSRQSPTARLAFRPRSCRTFTCKVSLPAAGVTGLAHERPVGAAQILYLERLAHPQHGVLARHRRIVDAHGARLITTDRHLSRAGQIERPDLLAREHDQLVRPLRRHRDRSIRSCPRRARRQAPSGSLASPARMTIAPNLPPIIASRYLPVRLIAKGGMGAVYEVEHARTGEHLALEGAAVQRGLVRRGARAVQARSASVGPDQERARGPRDGRGRRSRARRRALPGDGAPRRGGSRTGGGLRPSRARHGGRMAATGRANARQGPRGWASCTATSSPRICSWPGPRTRAPIVKILDFGIVKMTEESAGGTGSGQILGTPKYMAPEQASAKGRVTSAADRYSLGLVAYRLLTGESYYSGDALNILAADPPRSARAAVAAPSRFR